MMRQYLDALKHIMDNGVDRDGRNGPTRAVFGMQMRYDMAEGFSAITTKRLYWKGVVHELLWFISGSTNVKYLREHGIKWWDAWADENGEIGPLYGKQLRNIEHSYWVEPLITHLPFQRSIHHLIRRLKSITAFIIRTCWVKS